MYTALCSRQTRIINYKIIIDKHKMLYIVCKCFFLQINAMVVIRKKINFYNVK